MSVLLIMVAVAVMLLLSLRLVLDHVQTYLDLFSVHVAKVIILYLMIFSVMVI